MKTGRPSVTAALVAGVRALYTELPAPYRIAEDPHAKDLVPTILSLPIRALGRVPWAAPIVHRGLALASFGLNHHVALRTRAIDDAVREAVRLGATQLVVLGAGLDSRAMRLEELAGVRVFEVDHPSTQRYKVERLASLRSPPRPKALRLERVEVDFEKDRIDRALPAAGFSGKEVSFWIWEGVTVYLTREAIADTLRSIAALSAPKSRVALTYTPVPSQPLPGWAFPLAERLLHTMGEPVRTLLDAGEVQRLLEEAGFELVSDDSTIDWGARYWPWQNDVRAVERLAIANRI